MNSRYNYRDDDTFKNNLETVYKNLIDKNIIYSTQYIHDEDINCDGDGFESYWEIVFLCIEKTENDYIFHIFNSDQIHSYAQPYFKTIYKFNQSSKKLSDIKETVKTISEKSKNEICNFIYMFENHLRRGLKCSDQNLVKYLKSLSILIKDLEIILDKMNNIDQKERDLQYQEYLKSDEYKAFIKERKEYSEKLEKEIRIKEDARLKLLIEKHGEELGRQYFNRL
jgi:hypothetical protein